jgi:hypothetical protein
MKHITVNGAKNTARLERKLSLHNGAIVLLKRNNETNSVYMVVSFRDDKNRYNSDKTKDYCTLLNLDTGYYAFEERCSRDTTVRRVLNHLLRLGCSNYTYNQNIPEDNYNGYDVEVINLGDYSIDISI